MCRNITELRGLQPPATAQEIEAAAAQFIRKVTGVARPTGAAAEAVQEAVREIAEITVRLLAELPARRQEPKTVPPLRRPEVRQRLGLEPLPAGSSGGSSSGGSSSGGSPSGGPRSARRAGAGARATRSTG